MREELLKGLSEEQIKKVKECKSSEEILDLAKAEGVQLSDEQLAAVSGGGCGDGNKCPQCGSKDITTETMESKGTSRDYIYKCRKCGQKWTKVKYVS